MNLPLSYEHFTNKPLPSQANNHQQQDYAALLPQRNLQNASKGVVRILTLLLAKLLVRGHFYSCLYRY